MHIANGRASARVKGVKCSLSTSMLTWRGKLIKAGGQKESGRESESVPGTHSDVAIRYETNNKKKTNLSVSVNVSMSANF